MVKPDGILLSRAIQRLGWNMHSSTKKGSYRVLHVDYMCMTVHSLNKIYVLSARSRAIPTY